MKHLMSGNEATARGVYEAGIKICSAYPGTPSTEILENLPQYKDDVYCEWAPNEKVATEVAYGASIAGSRSFCTMKMVGLNVAADPLFTAGYMGVGGAFIVVTADDPSCHSSQNEQDNRHYARAAKIAMVEPSDAQECKDFVALACEVSELFDTPVLYRTTTRVCHSKGLVEFGERREHTHAPYARNVRKFVCTPAHAYANHPIVEERLKKLEEYGCTRALENGLNKLEMGDGKVGVITASIAYEYAKEVFPEGTSFLKLGLTYPLPMNLIRDFASKVEKLYVIEELEPFMENEIKAAGIDCIGKELTGVMYELNTELVRERVLGIKPNYKTITDLTGIDPGHVVGEDGKRYLYVDKGAIAPLSDDGLKVTGPKKTVYEGWQFPKEWKTEGNGDMFLEGPKLLHKDGYYYMVSAEGGTAGPATSHMVVVARSKSVFGPWENSPYNPLVHTYSASDPWWSKGHGTLIDDAEGNWWVVYHAYAQGYHTLGRQTLIDPVEWTADGWVKLRHDARPLPAQDPEKHGLELSDDFTGKQLGLQWTFWKEYAPESLSFGKDGMSVKAKGKTPADGRLLMVTATDKNYELTTEITLGKGNTGGLLLFYDEKAYAGVASDGKTFTIYRNGEKTETMPSDYHKHFHLRLLNRANRVTLSASKDGKSWKELATDIDVSGLHHNNYGGFYALRPALLSTGKGRTTFRNFTYRDATPQEKDMAAYLMVFHQDEDHCLYAPSCRNLQRGCYRTS